MKVVDSHHHLWDLNHLYYPWLTDRIRKVPFGDYSAMRHDYLVKDFLADASDVALVKSVHIQADCDPHDALAETEWLQSVADEPASRGFPHAIIAYADLSRDDARTILSGHCRSRNVRGIRQMLHHSRMSDPSVSSIEYLSHPIWLRNLDLLREYKLSFDLQLLPEQMSQAARVVERNSDIQFILCHMGSPHRGGLPDLREWRAGIRQLAGQSNVSVKISGLNMYDQNWTIDSVRPLVREVIDIFGITRCMFGSNFPVEGLASNYSSVWAAYTTMTDDFTIADRERLFSENAERIYRI
jgi:predicted TIM-barrel fold metal-dependent hydrolase